MTLLIICFQPRTGFGAGESFHSDKQILTIYDLDNKFIAYSASFDDVIDVVAEWGAFYILTRDQKMFVLQEKDTQTKLEVSARRTKYSFLNKDLNFKLIKE